MWKSASAAAVLAVVLTLAGGAVAGAGEKTTLGEGVDEGELTPIAKLVAEPDAWEGKVVRVKGEVTGVCKRMGCWMMLEDEGASVRIKVKDGVIVFPVEAIGKSAVAQGVVAIMELSRDNYVAMQRHFAEANDEEFDESTVGEGPFRIVQIRGTGAEIEG